MVNLQGKEQWLILLLAIVVSTMGQVCLKLGASSESFMRQLLDLKSLIGLSLYAVSAMLYMAALRSLPMSVALPSTAFSYVIITFIGATFFGEIITMQQIICLSAIVAGVVGLTI